MAITITSVVFRSMHVNFVGGVGQEFVFEYDGIDSNGGVYRGQYRKPLTPTQQTNLTNFVNNIITQAQTDTGLTITIG